MPTRGVHVLYVAIALALPLGGCDKSTHDAPASLASAASESSHPGCGARPYAPSARLVLRRTACYGTCPVYSVEVQPNGTIIYTGDAYVRIFGAIQTNIPPALATALFDRAACVPPDVWSKSYRLAITDNPTAEVSVDLGKGSVLKVEDYPPCHDEGDNPTPPAICALENAIDSAAGTAKWTECKGADGGAVACLRSAPIPPDPKARH